MKCQRYAFMLMEIMIGLTITSLALGMIFSSLYQGAILKKKIEKMEEAVMSHMALQQFLDRVFANHISTGPQSLQGTFYTTNPSQPQLMVTFDNDFDSDSRFSGKVLGMLSIENGDLVFTLQKEKKYKRKKTLRKDVKTLSFEFLASGIYGLESFSTWDESRSSPPSFVKVTLNKNEDYVFWVNQPCQEIPLKLHKEAK